MFMTIIIVGNLGKEPEMRFTPAGKAVTSFSVATNRSYTNNNGETVKETTWFRVSAWERQAETCNQYLKKGSKVMVEGRLTADKETGGPRIWNDTDGNPRTSFEVSASRVVFLSSKGDDGPPPLDEEGQTSKPVSSGNKAKTQDQEFAEDFDEDQIPF